MHSLDIHETCTNTDGEMIFNSDLVMQPDDVVLCVLSSDTATFTVNQNGGLHSAFEQCKMEDVKEEQRNYRNEFESELPFQGYERKV
jgi:hypothetical protein